MNETITKKTDYFRAGKAGLFPTSHLNKTAEITLPTATRAGVSHPDEPTFRIALPKNFCPENSQPPTISE
jgi:hypothetical protein